VLIGETQDALWYLDLIRSQSPIAALRDFMMFGRPATKMAA
jgi:nitrite reductase (NADH) large subunit